MNLPQYKIIVLIDNELNIPPTHLTILVLMIYINTFAYF